MSQSIAITGATGFIGRKICWHLHHSGYSVRALVRDPVSASTRLPPGTQLIRGSLETPSSLALLVRNASGIIHCAGSVRGNHRQDFDQVNVSGTENLVNALSATKEPLRLVLLSSLAAREPQLSWYAGSKRGSECLLENSDMKAPWIALRPPAVYGPGDKEMLPLFQMMGRGLALLPGARSSRFSLLYIDDLVNAILAWLKAVDPPTGIFTLHDGKANGYSWDELGATIGGICERRVRLLTLPSMALNLAARANHLGARLRGQPAMLTPQKMQELTHPDWVCDNHALQAALDWQPQFPLVRGLKMTPGWAGSA